LETTEKNNQILWESLEITPCVRVLAGKGLPGRELNPILAPREAPEGLCDDNPHGSAFA